MYVEKTQTFNGVQQHHKTWSERNPTIARMKSLMLVLGNQFKRTDVLQDIGPEHQKCIEEDSVFLAVWCPVLGLAFGVR
jgi:hypothetical protein